MRVPALLVSLFGLSIVLCGNAFAGGTVGFNVNWYSTPQLPFDDIVDGGDCEVTTGVVIADFNRDGIPDVAYSYPTCGAGGGGVIAKLGTGGGKLGPDIFSNWGADTLAEMATADINGDGRLDLVLRDPVSFCLLWVQGNGDGTFQQMSGIGCINGGQVAAFTLGDFNNDGKVDLADIGCDQENGGFPFESANCTLYVFLGDGMGGFTQSQSVKMAPGETSYTMQSADINGDGNLDLVNVRGSQGLIWWGRGNGTFAAPTYLKPPTTDPLDAAAIADFNNDGQLDVALLSGNPCRPDPNGDCDGPNPNTVWMYKNNGGTNFTLTMHTQFASQSGVIVPADINGDLNQDLLRFNPFANGIYPVLEPAGGFEYALGLGNDAVGTQGSLPGSGISAVAFRDMDGDSRGDFAVIDWFTNELGIGIQTGGWTNCPPPSSANLAAKICGTSNGATVTSPLLLKASGNSPAGVGQLQVWIDGKKQYVKWGDQLAKRFTLSPGAHRIAVVANDKYVGHATAAVNVIVQ
jgi:hypothetical protein